jgi:dipeptidyl aminopeptidase/acylaminoacyl peptidase
MRLTIIGILTLFVWQVQAQTERLTVEKLWQLGRVSLEDVSPDGQTVLYGVTYYDVPANKGNRDLYIVATTGGETKKITAFEESEYNGEFRPDGKKIGFLRAGKLWEMNPDGSDQRKVSEVEMNGFHYSPDGKQLLFCQDVKFGQKASEHYPDLPKTEARVIDDLMYRHFDSWDDFHYSNIFVAPYGDGKLQGEPRNIQNEPYDSPLGPDGGMEQIAWNPDGKSIAYTAKKLRGKQFAQSTNSEIFLFDLTSGSVTNVSEGFAGYDLDPVFSPDGRYLAWTSQERNGFEADRRRIYMLDFQSNKKWELTRGLDREALHAQWSPDGKTMHFITGEKATYQLASIDVATQAFRFVTKGVHDYTAFKVANGQTLVGTRASLSMPHELYRVDVRTGSQTPITSTNQALLRQIKMGDVKEQWTITSDGKNMLVWMVYPPDFDATKKYPTLLYCQGGPQSAVSQFWSYRWNLQLMAANGYIIVAPNRRGLPSFGQEWNDQISGDWSGRAMQDYLNAIDDAVKQPYVDHNNLGAVGASFGGFSVYWLAGNHNKRFKAFIAHAGMFNMESWYGTTEELFFADWDLGGPYWHPKVKDAYLKSSPHRFVDKWDTPIMVMHGEKDFRVPIGEAMQAFQAAQVKGVPSKFVYFPDENHWILKPQNSWLWQREFYGWLDKWLKPSPGTKP